MQVLAKFFRGLLLIFSLSVQLHAQSNISMNYLLSAKYDSLKGPVKEVWVNEELAKGNTYIVDTTQESYSLTGLEHNSIYRYNKTGKLTYSKKTIMPAFSAEITDYINSIKHDERGNVIEYSGSTTSLFITYNANNLEIESKCISREGALLGHLFFKYDNNGNLLENIKATDSTSFLNGAYKYDERQNLIAEIYYNPDKTVNGYHYYHYDSKNRLVVDSEFTTRRNNVWKKRTLQYNEHNHPTEEITTGTDYSNPLKLRYEYRYNSKGDIIETKEFIADIVDGNPQYVLRQSETFSDFDKYGNYLKKLRIVPRGSYMEMIEQTRKITYWR